MTADLDAIREDLGYLDPLTQRQMRYLVAEVEELRSKVALLTGAMLFDTGKRPVWSDNGRTLRWEPVDEIKQDNNEGGE